MDQLSSVGFCLVTNVKGHSEEELLEAIKAFHELSLETKLKMSPRHFVKGNESRYRGYFPFLQDDTSHKEFYDMTRPISDISEWEQNGCPLY